VIDDHVALSVSQFVTRLRPAEAATRIKTLFGWHNEHCVRWVVQIREEEEEWGKYACCAVKGKEKEIDAAIAKLLWSLVKLLISGRHEQDRQTDGQTDGLQS